MSCRTTNLHKLGEQTEVGPELLAFVHVVVVCDQLSELKVEQVLTRLPR